MDIVEKQVISAKIIIETKQGHTNGTKQRKRTADWIYGFRTGRDQCTEGSSADHAK